MSEIRTIDSVLVMKARAKGTVAISARLRYPPPYPIYEYIRRYASVSMRTGFDDTYLAKLDDKSRLQDHETAYEGWRRRFKH